MKKPKIGLIMFPAFDWQISNTHPERRERLLYTKDQLEEEGLDDLENIFYFNPTVASKEDINRTHFVLPSQENIVTDSHYVAAGSAIKAIDLIMTKTVDKVFSIARPPGHHAMEVVYGDRGFCVINNEAVMVEYLRSKYGNDLKVAIIDTDCHHGDGTENIFENDPNTLFISVHQDGRTLYPGTGFLDDFGKVGGYGYNINIPLPPNTGDSGYLYVAENIINPIIKDFKPDIIIQGAGQDNHYSDPLTNMNLSAQGYAKLTAIINADILVLEGGYSIEGALPYLNLAIILSLAKEDYSNVIEPDFNIRKVTQDLEVTNYIKNLGDKILANWNNKEKLKLAKYGNKELVVEERNIYYDTSNIMENQTITYYNCKNCSGLKVIKTKNNYNLNAKLINIPRDACKKCQNESYLLYNKDSKYQQTILRDKIKDLYLEKNQTKNSY